MTEALVALDYHLDVPKEVALVWPPGASPDALAAVLRTTFVPNRALAAAPEGPALDAIARLVPFIAGKVAQSGAATAYVCKRGLCDPPTTDAATFRAQLSK